MKPNYERTTQPDKPAQSENAWYQHIAKTLRETYLHNRRPEPSRIETDRIGYVVKPKSTN